MNEQIYLKNRRNRNFKRRKKVINLFDIPKKSKILDFGCGAGFDLECFKQLGYKNLVGIDYSKNFISKIKEFEVYCRDAHHTQFKDNSFDVVFASAILHHMHFYEAFVEIKRILKSRGLLCFKENRKSICRTILKIMCFSFLANYSKFLMNRRNGYISEAKEYWITEYWLRNQKLILITLKALGFKILFVKKTLFGIIVKARLEK